MLSKRCKSFHYHKTVNANIKTQKENCLAKCLKSTIYMRKKEKQNILKIKRSLI